MSRAAAREMADKIAAYLSEPAPSLSAAEYLGSTVNGLKIRRDPPVEALPAEQLRSVLQFWLELPKVDGIPNIVKVEPEQVREALGYLILLDTDEENDDFRYSLYGSRIAEVTGFDMTGKSIWSIATSQSVQIFFAGCYMAALRLRCPIYTIHESPPFISVSLWHRIILPLGLNGAVSRFLVCNLPIHEGQVR